MSTKSDIYFFFIIFFSLFEAGNCVSNVEFNNVFVLTDKKKFDKLDLDDPRDYDIKTVTSALKNYLR